MAPVSFNCKITQQGTAHTVTVSPALPGHTYALYALAKKIGANAFEKIRVYKYQRPNSFVFVADNDHEEVCFRYFAKNRNGDVVCAAKSSIVGKSRPILALKNLNFQNSFDVDLVNDYVTPIKYQRIGNSSRHYILFNGALNKNFKMYPIFNRHKWGAKINANMLNIYDSALNPGKDYLLGWYYGTQQRPLANEILPLINTLKTQRNLTNKDLVFYGSSGGGWAALRYASLFPGSLAVAINPQIDILRYQYETSIRTFLQHSYPGMERSAIESTYSSDFKINPLPYLKSADGDRSRFILAQNIVDEHHYQHHYLPFWGNFSKNSQGGWDDDRHNYSVVYDHPSGHSAEPEEVFVQLQQMIASMTGKLAVCMSIAGGILNEFWIGLPLA